MQLGFLTDSIADIEKAARLGFDSVELNASALGNATEASLDKNKIAQVQQLCKHYAISITALAYYDMAFNPPASHAITSAYTHVFEAAERLGVHVIASMSGFDASRNWDENIQLFADHFGPVADVAEQRGMRLALENWMGFGGPLPHKPVNMGGSPDTWDAWFQVVPSKALGLEFDPSHLYWQGIDYLRALREFKDRVYHVHAKDTELLPEVRYRKGVIGDAYRFRIPGYGDINWTAFISTLNEIGYDGGIAIEHEDFVVGEQMLTALRDSTSWHMIGYNKRSDPATMYVKQEIERLRQSGELGSMRYVRITMPEGDWMVNGFFDLIRTDEPYPQEPADPAPDDMDAATYKRYWEFVN